MKREPEEIIPFPQSIYAYHKETIKVRFVITEYSLTNSLFTEQKVFELAFGESDRSNV